MEQTNNLDDILKKIKNGFLSLSSEQLLKLLNPTLETSIDPNSPMYILPNGKIISVSEQWKRIELKDMFDDTHYDLIKAFLYLYMISENLSNDDIFDITCYNDGESVYQIYDDMFEKVTYDFGWARVNCGKTWNEHRFYCVLPDHMTNAQFRTLEEWIEWGYSENNPSVIIYAGKEQNNKIYSFSNNLPEDIIKKIRRYYSSGTLYENRKGMRENMANELEQRAKKHKKKSKGIGWHMAVNAGDVEKGIEVFNNSVGDISGMCEDLNKSETIDLYYSELTVEKIVEIIPATYWEPSEVDTCEGTVEYEYTVDKTSVEELIGDLITTEDFPQKDNATDEEFWKFIEDNFDSLFDKYEKEILGHFEDDAREEWEENHQYDDYYNESFNESLHNKKRYIYEGPVYYCGKVDRNNFKKITAAESLDKAINNILWTLCNGKRWDMNKYDIDRSKLTLLDKETKKVEKEYPIDDEPHICANCGYKLTDSGECPICDLGDEGESLSSLEALWNLNRYDFD